MQDSSQQEFWERRYREGVMPWEGAELLEPARKFFSAQPRMRMLLPGCGSASDMPPLLGMGHDVLAVDFSESALELARRQWPDAAGRLMLADFFQLDLPAFDCVFERAFLCALPISMRKEYAAGVARMVKPGGVLAGVFFLAKTDRGPPFGMDIEQLEALVGQWFFLEDKQHLPDGLHVFRGQEYWMVWRRRKFDLDQVSTA
ncbi:hypothetical protein BI347_12555 [Chromobacterium sphagni]|uniref:SAM-dependent methyltransferase n=1 Tax=Chromobacterium sphagni TaxID=1903179 RepID=A0A1S1X488_9NEIS|nr:methyltransferase domain-containing protein [Chromobacterium sphagni]OHX14240.1 hypothetical protein BI347_12555 [Chromobacterium sphagni]